MKIALAQLNFRVGDFTENVSRIIGTIEKAKSAGAGLVVFAELSVCGYPPRDFLEFDDFIRRCDESVNAIAAACTGIAAIVGAPSVNPAPKGKPLYNTAFFLAGGKILARIHKTLLPNYDVFDEYRYFEPNRLQPSVVEWQGYRFALTICEDLWNIADDPLYVRNPMDDLTGLNTDVLINIAASPFNYNQARTRLDILSRNAKTYNLPVVYVNQVGGQTELVFDGGSLVLDAAGVVVAGLRQFEEDLQVVEIPKKEHPKEQETDKTLEPPIIQPNPQILKSPNPQFPESPNPQILKSPNSPIVSIFDFTSPETSSLIYHALVLGIRDYFGKLGFQKAVLGLSGGIDSAVTLVLAVAALGRENVRAILLPSQYSSDHSITDARLMAENLEVPYDIIPIEGAFRSLELTLEPYFTGFPFNLTEENIQARIRGVILMALSNKFGYIVLNTSNKSEAAVGYGTLYGDMCGGLSVLGDVYKVQVYSLARYINRESFIIPENTILKPPSAELRPGQKDSDSLPEYEILDQILFRYIEQRTGPDELIRGGFDERTVRRVLKLVNTNEYKRAQTPPVLRVSPKAFGMGRRMPIVARYLS